MSQQGEGVPEGRRRLLKALSALMASALAGAAAVPVLGTLLTPLLRTGHADRGLLRACREDELVPGVPRRVELSSEVVDGWTRSVAVVGAAWVLKRADGQVSALSAICPHSGCGIAAAGKSAYACPCHDSEFTLDGARVTGPSPRPMDRLQAEVKDGQVWVKWVRFQVGTKDQRAL